MPHYSDRCLHCAQTLAALLEVCLPSVILEVQTFSFSEFYFHLSIRINFCDNEIA